MNIEEHEKNKVTIKLLEKLIKAENSVKSDDNWLDEDQVKAKLEV